MMTIADLKHAEDRAFRVAQALQVMLKASRENARLLQGIPGAAPYAFYAAEQAEMWATHAAEASEAHDLLMYRRELAEYEERVADGTADQFALDEIVVLRGRIAKLEGGRPRRVA